MKYIEQNLKEEIKAIIEDRHIPVTESGCWLWTASATKQGYGDFRYKTIHYLAHQASFMAYNGAIHDGMHVMHKCDVRLCCNPNHLMLGTNADNINDSVAKGRRKGVTRNRPQNLQYQKISDDLKIKIFNFIKSNNLTIPKVAKIFNIPSSTAYSIFKKLNNGTSA
jgi:hypothetical protein